MRITKTLQINERQIEIKELTVGEVRKWLRDRASGKAEDVLLFADIDASMLQAMAGMDESQLDEFTGSEVERIIALCKEVNPHFFQTRDRVRQQEKESIEMLKSNPDLLKLLPADSQEKAMALVSGNTPGASS